MASKNKHVLFLCILIFVAACTPIHSKQKMYARTQRLFWWNFDSSAVDVVDDIVWWSAIDGATNVLCGTQDFFGGSAEFTSHRTWSQGAGNADDIIQSDVATVFDCS